MDTEALQGQADACRVILALLSGGGGVSKQSKQIIMVSSADMRTDSLITRTLLVGGSDRSHLQL